VKNACDILRARLAPVAAKLFSSKTGCNIAPEIVTFANDVALVHGIEVEIPFSQVVVAAYVQRISLSSTGFYRTPEIHYDRAKGKGKPFHYFAVGAAVTEVEVDGFTGMSRILRTDILHDAGDSINPAINLGQIEGGFVQGAGWLTCEELVWNDQGVLLTHSPDTYKIPAVGDRPLEFNVQLLKNAAQPNTIHGSKAVGEPPLMLAISVREAIRDAVAAFGSGSGEIALASPATAEAIWRAIQKQLEAGPATRNSGE
jgi:xanthine dehydrogenase molybdopterin-binding subunit B